MTVATGSDTVVEEWKRRVDGGEIVRYANIEFNSITAHIILIVPSSGAFQLIHNGKTPASSSLLTLHHVQSTCGGK